MNWGWDHFFISLIITTAGYLAGWAHATHHERKYREKLQKGEWH